MKELLADLGHLAAFKKMNRDDLAERIGTTRQNLISAFKGRRPLPSTQMPPLRQALGLDESYHFDPVRVHVLTANQGEKQRDFLLNLLQRCMSLPVRSKWLLRGIGEGRSSFAYVFEDSREVLVVVRNDDVLLDASVDSMKKTENPAERAGQAVDGHITALFSCADGSPNREIALEDFNTLFTEGISAENLRAVLNSAAKVWTWARLREKAEQAGQNAESIARALGFVGSLPD
jgi:hypothetical protein